MIVDVFCVYSYWFSAGLWPTPSVFTFLRAWIVSGFMLWMKYFIKTNSENVYIQGRVQGGGAQGIPAPNIIGLCVIIFHTDYIFRPNPPPINHMHLSLNNVLYPQLSIFMPEESHQASFMVIASYIMSFDCWELTHGRCLVCCLLVCWKSWQDNL